MSLVEEEIVKIQEIFAEVLAGFSYNHAKIYSSLLSSEVKAVKQIVNETGFGASLVYKILNDLSNFGLISKTNMQPASYYIQKPILTYNSFIKKQTRLLEENKNILKQIAYKKTSEGKNRYVVDEFPNGEIQITNANTKTPVKEHSEMTRLHKIIDEAEKRLPKEENKYLLAYACARR